MEHRIQRDAKIVPHACRRDNRLHDSVGERIADGVHHDGIPLPPADSGGRAIVCNGVRILIPRCGIPGGVRRKTIAVERSASHHLRAWAVIKAASSVKYHVAAWLP
jgi:hypothetical protein